MSINKIILNELTLKKGKGYNVEYAKDIISAYGIPLEFRNLEYYVGSHGSGDIYKVKGKNKVVKLYGSDEEFKIIETVKSMRFENICNYFYNSEFRNHYIAVMEFLEPVDIKYTTEDSYTINLLGRNFQEIVDMSRMDIDAMQRKTKHLPSLAFTHFLKKWKGIVGSEENYIIFIASFMKSYAKYTTTTDNIKTLKKLTDKAKFYNDVINGLKEFYEDINDYEDVYLHVDNILQDTKTKKYKLVDPFFRK